MRLMGSVAVLVAALVAGAARAGEAQVAVVRTPDTSQSNPYYPGNRPPLLASPFIRLPTGTVRPQGWVRRQLELEAEGYIGHMGEVSGFLNKTDNAWLKADGKGGCFWEEVPYWLRGYASMAFLLEDPKLIAEARLWLEPSIVGQRGSGYFGTEALAGNEKNAPDLMPHQNMLYAYRSYYDATGDKRVEVQLDGAAKVDAEGRHIVIRSDDPYAENSLDRPRRIVPQEQTLPGCGVRFSVMLQPYSVNVLRVPASEK